jgi:hypothetical protein
VMGTSWRAVEGHLDDAPGPGAYNIPKFIGSDGAIIKKASPSFSIRGREKFGSVMDSKDAAKLPGPGAYTVTVPKDSIKPTIAGKWRPTNSQDKKPGPGTYKIPGAFGSQMLVSVCFSLFVSLSL